MKTCPKCSIEHNKLGDYCSRSCANSRGPRTDEFKKNVSKKLTGKLPWCAGKHLVDRITKKCLNCSKEFTIKSTEHKKYCSELCWRHNSGGYREGSGRAKSGYFRGIYCGSTYELVWIIYSLDHNIQFTRFSGKLELNGVVYYPDFLLDDNKTIIETKGYEAQESVDKKTKLAESLGYIVKILRKTDLEYAFAYVKKKYNTTEYHTLYDGYKPLYHYTCSHCSIEFRKDKKLKTNVVFCSRQCAGKGHKGRKKLSL